MSLVNRLISFVFNIFEVGLARPVEQVLDIFVKVALIAFEAQNVVSALVNNLFGNRLLCPHGINRDNAT